MGRIISIFHVYEVWIKNRREGTVRHDEACLALFNNI